MPRWVSAATQEGCCSNTNVKSAQAAAYSMSLLLAAPRLSKISQAPLWKTHPNSSATQTTHIKVKTIETTGCGSA
eukprot:2290966-Amphidinium_carterae.1